MLSANSFFNNPSITNNMRIIVLGLSQRTILAVNFVHDHLFFSAKLSFQGQVRTISGPSAAALTGQGAERCGQKRLGGRGNDRLGAGHSGHMRNYIHLLHMRSMYKIDRGGGGPKIVLQETTIVLTKPSKSLNKGKPFQFSNFNKIAFVFLGSQSRGSGLGTNC